MISLGLVDLALGKVVKGVLGSTQGKPLPFRYKQNTLSQTVDVFVAVSEMWVLDIVEQGSDAQL